MRAVLIMSSQVAQKKKIMNIMSRFPYSFPRCQRRLSSVEYIIQSL